MTDEVRRPFGRPVPTADEREVTFRDTQAVLRIGQDAGGCDDLCPLRDDPRRIIVDIIGVVLDVSTDPVAEKTATPHVFRPIHCILRDREEAECLPGRRGVEVLDDGVGRHVPHERHLIEEEFGCPADRIGS